MFRNYGFGDLSVTASEADTDIDNLSSFAALRSSDGALTIMVIAKALTGVTPVNISLANYLPSGAPAQWWQLNANAITQQADIMFAGSTLSFNANPETVNLLIIPGAYLSAPASVNASATGNSVTVSWPPAANANSYEVYRATSINGPYTDIGPHPSGFSDSSLAFDTTYLYKVVSMHGGAVVSPASALDAATTTTFSNDPLSAGIGVQAAHITQLRTAVTAMWATAALGAPVFADTPLTTSTAIKGTHITQLRSALDQARSTLGLSAMAYTDPTITTTTTVKAAHITELRNGVK